MRELLEHAQLIQQGAEARAYKATLETSSPPIIIKHRFQKMYRHPSLDTSLTKTRVTMEARALMRCLRSGVCVPGIRMVDPWEGIIGVEFIDGPSIRGVLGGENEEGEYEGENEGPSVNEDLSYLRKHGATPGQIMRLVGQELAKMHAVDVVHGDLTTSNMMLRPTRSSLEEAASPFPLEVLIDFGLSFQSALVEDKAVDLYVLERAFISTHPDSEGLFSEVLDGYSEAAGDKAWSVLKRRLDDVRLRGRKRSMVG
ncbi:serine/threonine-protein kinase bud32 [Tulasnella sp. JGI-2019a]|nr:serine/threonine-protein kinase bud32 [Tulasnella sp. JGI-2019a]KAG9008739.1 serine/threonine-protein kinase bud32 [Tulasnella sp. JGI-2019a]